MKNRKEIEERLFRGMAGIYPKPMYDDFKRLVTNMSDEDFDGFVNAALNHVPETQDASYHKRMLENQKELIKTFNPQGDFSAMQEFKVSFLDKEMNDKILSSFKSSRPSTQIYLKQGVEDEMRKSFIKKKEDFNGIPADIIFSGHVPIEDLEIINEVFDDFTNEIVPLRIRVKMYPDYLKRISESDETVPVAVVILYLGNNAIFKEIEVMKGMDYMMVPDKIGIDEADKGIKNQISSFDAYTMDELIGSLVITWYFCQLALLHPIVKNVFSNPRAVIDENRSKRKPGKKPVLKYIKRNVIRVGDIEKENVKHGYTRKTFVWHVMGHWRTYKSGKKVFIKPFWKGLLRDSKQTDEPRERQIVTE